MLASLLLHQALLTAGVAPLLSTSAVVGLLAGGAALLERRRPERKEYLVLDRPLLTEAAHFLFNYNLGYALALGGSALLGAAMGALRVPPLWPTAWPLLAQFVLAGLLAEGASYWQHRLAHRVPWLWRFHALHHSGERMNLLRAGRFHFLDIGPAVFVAFAPSVLLGAPERITSWLAVISGSIGVVQHANLRMRTPALLDRLLCTPADHRYHHSRDARESDGNFGSLFMIFDQLFGTYVPPTAPAPAALGIERDPVRRGFWNELIDPLRPSRDFANRSAE